MLMGQNLDVSYRGKVVHIQTEDLGRNVAKVMTQVFHSGAILDSKTVSYAEEIARLDDVGQQNDYIRQLMLRLSKWFHKSIHSGAYDAKLKLAPLELSETEAVQGARPQSALSDGSEVRSSSTVEAVPAQFVDDRSLTSTDAHEMMVVSDTGSLEHTGGAHLDIRATNSAASRSDMWRTVARTQLSGTVRSFAGDLDFSMVDEQLVSQLVTALHAERT